MAKQNETPAATDAFPEVEAIKSMPVARRVPNPALDIVRDAVGQGPKRIPVTDDKDASRRRGQLARAGTDLGFKVKTKLNKPFDGYLFFEVTRKESAN
jgi:hypothetical protein